MLSPQDILAIKKLREEAPKIFQEISEEYLQPFDGSKKADLYDGKLERSSHGSIHVNRVAALIRPIWQFYCWLGDEAALKLTEEEIFLLELVALHHDIARKNDGKDLWEKESYARCEKFLLEKGISPETAKLYAYLIVQKDKGGILGEIFQGGDALDIARCKQAVILNRVSLYYNCKGRDIAERALLQLAEEIRQLIADQGDLLYTCKIKISETEPIVSPALKATRDTQIKIKYEQAKDCFQKIKDDFAKYPLLNALDKGDFVTHPLLQNPPEIDEWYKDLLAVKTIRGDERCFILKFLLSLTQTDIFKYKEELRLSNKREVIVTGEGIFNAEEKPPMYSSEEKSNFSSVNSWSIVSNNGPAPVFNFAGKQKKSAGFITDPRDVLFYYLFTYDGGTVGRPNHFDTKEAAEKYYENVVLGNNPKLFPLRQLKKFIGTVINSQNLNEVLLRTKISKNLCIGIFSKDFPSRLLALCFQKVSKRILKPYIKEIENSINKENNKISEEYKAILKYLKDLEFPIKFYLPNDKNKNGKIYSADEQAEDIKAAQECFKNQKNRKKQFAINNFEFLLFVENTSEMLQNTFYKGIPILLYILRQGYVHIATELLLQAPDYSLNELTNWLGRNSRDKTYSEPALPYLALQDDHTLWAWFKLQGADINSVNHEGNTALLTVSMAGRTDEALYLLEKYPDIAINCKDKAGKTPLHYYVIWKNKQMVAALLEKGADVNITNKDGNTLLHYAVQTGYVEVVKLLLKKNPDINIRNKDKQTALHIAAEYNNLEIVKLLIDNVLQKNQNEVINLKDDNGSTILHYAVQLGYTEVVKSLIANKVNINAQRKNGNTALHIAAELNNIEIVKLLVENKATIDVLDKDEFTFTPLFCAVLKQNLEVVKYLLENGANPVVTYATLISISISDDILTFAIKNQKFEVAKYLLSLDINLKKSAKIVSLLEWAIKKNDLKIIELLLDKGHITPNQSFFTINDKGAYAYKIPLQLAIEYNNMAVIDCLLKKGADVNKNISTFPGFSVNSSVIHCAVESRNIEIVKRLVENGANIDVKAKTADKPISPLEWALRKDYYLIAKYFFLKNAKIDSKFQLFNLFKLALIHNDVSFAESLLEEKRITLAEVDISYLMDTLLRDSKFNSVLWLAEKGINVKILSMSGKVIFYAAKRAIDKNELKVLNFLLSFRHINIDSKDDEGYSLLHFAVLNGSLESVQILIKHNANINLINKYGQSPLYFAAYHKKLEITKCLLDKGALFKKEGITALELLELAINNNDLLFLNILIQKGLEVRLIHLTNKPSLILMTAILNKEHALINLLIDNGFKPTPDDQLKILEQLPKIEQEYTDEQLTKILRQIPSNTPNFFTHISQTPRLSSLYGQIWIEEKKSERDGAAKKLITNQNMFNANNISKSNSNNNSKKAEETQKEPSYLKRD